MKLAAVISLLLTNVLAAYTQEPQFKWVSSFGSNEFIYSRSIITDANGNLYTMGVFSGTHDFDSGPGTFELSSKGLNDIFIVKTDPGGNFVWARSIGGNGEEFGYTLLKDVNGNIYMSGEFQLTVDFDPGSAISNHTAEQVRDMFICKLDPSGNFMWAVTIPGLGEQAANFLSTDPAGNVYMGGNFTGQIDFDPGPNATILSSDEQLGDMFILKLDASGNFIWVRKIEIDVYGYIFDISVDQSGNVYTTGNFRGIVDFDPGSGVHSVTSNGLEDSFIMKLDAAGNFQWVAQFGGAGIDNGTSVDIDNNGNIYAVGEFTGIVDFDPGAAVYNLVNTDGFAAPYVMKLDASGNLVWAKKVGGINSVIYDLAIGNAGEIYITGLFTGTLDFEPASPNDDLTANQTDMFLARYDADGTFQWSQQVTGPGNDYGVALTVDDYGNIFTTGVFHQTADFDPGPGVHELSSANAGDVYILKTGICTNTINNAITEATCKSFTLNDRTYTSSGIYNQTILNSSGCDSTITLNLTVSGNDATSITKSICQGGSFEGYNTAGVFTDVFTTAAGCDSTRILTLTVVDKPKPNLGEDFLLCKGDSVSIFPGQFDAYAWRDGSTSDRLIVTNPGVYSVTVQSACGSATDEIIVRTGPCGVYFPSAFTPNRDGLNDEFKTITRSDFFSSYHLIIYNRWGQKIFESKDPSKGWDGKVNGTLQSAETFIWACDFIQRDNGLKDSKRGTVTLMR